ncbi:MAG TPA: acetyl-CoA carboxylase biotin carboxyl carrier protein [Paracoccaceae bacterium]|nr:acetyl-CoA carboxylase biotin carboxyl carrier protein [Paracoccaceae bacterium]
MSKTHDADIDFIRQLAALLTETELSEIEVKREWGEDDQLQVRVARAAPVQAPYAPPPPAAAPAPAPVPAAAEPTPPASSDVADDLARHPGAVASPMVGTAYLQPEPGSEPYVRLGDSVSEGQTLMIIEAMKTMNAIPAPRAGIVKRILVDDGAPVEFGAPLMIVE